MLTGLPLAVVGRKQKPALLICTSTVFSNSSSFLATSASALVDSASDLLKSALEGREAPAVFKPAM